ncbi:hypothetical protein ACJMK2_005613 [Sinanodonta woodiana]|uniref:Protein-serine/threonine phosphatase n=1 Tax=Sinanodonta woodiana TaxID=1069815 RepID=A0ABD3VQL9_SINWO
MENTVDTSVSSGIYPSKATSLLQSQCQYTLVLDARPFMAYNITHIVSAINVHCPPILKRRSNGFVALENIVPCETSRKLLLEGHFRHVIVYDAQTTDLAISTQDSNLYSVLKSLRQQVELDEVYYIIGGFKEFSALYPDLCVRPGIDVNENPLSFPALRRHCSKNGPVEIIDGLYLGDSQSSSHLETLRDIGITALLNVSTTCKNMFESDFKYKNIPVNDTETADLTSWFNEANNFIDSVRNDKGKVLVHCHAGISRSATICIAYLMCKDNLTLEQAYDHVKSRRSVISPNLNFMRQLQDFEKKSLSTPSQSNCSPDDDYPSSGSSMEFDFNYMSSSVSLSSNSFDFSFASPSLPASPRTPLMSST